MRKTICPLLCTIMVFLNVCFCCCATYAEEKNVCPRIITIGDYDYTLLDDETVEILKYHGDTVDLIIPSELDGRTITSIGENAFSFCNNLTTITLPDSLTSIGANPFHGCSSLRTITISPDHPTLATIDGVLFSKPDKRLICYPCGFTAEAYTVPQGILSIGNDAFFLCNLSTITFPEGLMAIGDDAFSYSYGLTSVTIPDSLTSIGVNPFHGCRSLQTITVSPDHPTLATIDGVLFSKPDKRLICYPCAFTAETYTVPQGILSIGDNAFRDCDSLTAITLPDSLSTLGSNPFQECRSLQTITVSPDHPTLATIDGVLFSKPDKRLICYPCVFTAKSYAIPQGILSIGDYAFYNCESLTAITLPDSLTAIGDCAFLYCSYLTNITLPNSLKTIGNYAFSYCDWLTDITLPDSLTTIGNHAFYYCNNLTAITLPDSLTAIGDDAFLWCDNLTLTVSRDSYAKEYCVANGLTYTYLDTNDWLNN